MKLIRSKILFLILLSLAPKAFAENTCHSLFEVARPSNAEINLAIGELKSLAAHRYSKDAETARVSNILYQRKLRELEEYISTEEIKDRFLKIKLPQPKINKKAIHANKYMSDIITRHMEVETYLSENGFRGIREKNNLEYYPLAFAIQQGRHDMIEKIIEAGADVHAAGKYPAIIVAAEKEDFTSLKLLLYKYKVNIETKDNDGITALLKASSENRIKVARFLLENNADINALSNDGVTSLSFAAYRGHLKIVKLLIQNKADVNIGSNLNIPALTWASGKQHIDVMKILLANNAIVNSRNYSGDTALHYAIDGKADQAVKLLLDHKADINLKGQDDMTPLMLAVKNRDANTVKLLLEHGADVTLRNSKGQTALGMITHFKRNMKQIERIKQMLIDAGATE